MLIPAGRIDEEPEILGRIRRGERIDHYETVRRRKDGSRVEISLTVSPIRDGRGKIVGASKIARDITERKRIEEQRATAPSRDAPPREEPLFARGQHRFDQRAPCRDAGGDGAVGPGEAWRALRARTS